MKTLDYRILIPRALLAMLMLGVGGCTTMISATTDEPIQEAPTERTFGSVIEDQMIETKASVNLRKVDPRLAQAHITVVSYNGVVLLAGQVGSAQLRELAARTVANVREVRRVHNALEISGKTTYIVRSNDAWITAKVKTKLLANDQAPGGQIKVVTENGVVYLLGLVSRADADRAAQIASSTDGTQKVVRLFEYID